MASPRTGRDDDIHNQSPRFVNVNFFTSDPALREAWRGKGMVSASSRAPWARTLWWRLANGHPPRLRSHDPQGRRIDYVEFHPASHRRWNACSRI